jgi:hypothetical protein
MMLEGVSHWPNVRDKPGFLHRLMVELAGDALISLEGDVSHCRFPDDLLVSREKQPVVTGTTPEPVQELVVLRLALETVEPIFKQVMAAGLKRAIKHVKIERNGVGELGAYDNFHSDCVVTGPGINPELLEEVTKSNILCDFKLAKSNSQ